MKITLKTDKQLLTQLAEQNPTLLQELWERNTNAGREYARYAAKKANFRNEARTDVVKLQAALENDGYRRTGTTFDDHVATCHYVNQENEISIVVHRNKGDLYGVFQKINSTQTEVILKRLTEPDERLQGIEQNMNANIKTLSQTLATISASPQTPVDDLLAQLSAIHHDATETMECMRQDVNILRDVINS